jgi:hypothetical protein
MGDATRSWTDLELMAMPASERLQWMRSMGFVSPPSNIFHIEDSTLRAEFRRRGLMPETLDVRLEAERLGLFAGEDDRRARALEWKATEMRQAFAKTEREWLATNAQLTRERDDWERRYRALSDRRPIGAWEALKLFLRALFISAKKQRA